MDNQLVAYFSASGVTSQIAQSLANAINADLYEIKPEIPYTKKDLNWKNPFSRTTKEMHNKKSRPAIIHQNLDINKYNVIFLGFPIWWYIAPTIVNTFLESYDFTNKTIILFASSGGSGFGKTVDNLMNSVDQSTIIKEGKILKDHVGQDELIEWVQSLNL
jgi:hypothetical protein